MAQTGNQATLTFPSISGDIVSITVGDQTVEMLDKSILSDSTWMKKLVADLIDAGEVSVVLHQDPTSDLLEPKTVGSLVITFPLAAGATTPANITGTAAVTTRKYPDFANNEIQEASLTFTWDGETPPAFTAQT